ncbi:MAG: TetR/AcrR family transcriptional regulator [Acidimicrobiia bacterium]|nr:TetR/AcrR family transcriptional regulator [Acidimicrobiia bacterium]
MDVSRAEASTRSAWEGRTLERSLSGARDRSSARAHRLVDAARTLAAERGSSEFTVAEVATRADVGLRTFYRYFAGRDDLLLALFEEETRYGAAHLNAVVGSEPAPLDRLRRYVVELCHLLVTGSGYASLLVREFLRLGETHPDELRVALAPMVDLLEVEMRSAAAAREIRAVDHDDAVVVFTLVLAHVHASVLFTSDDTSGDGEDSAASAERLWGFCRSGLLPGSDTR